MWLMTGYTKKTQLFVGRPFNSRLRNRIHWSNGLLSSQFSHLEALKSLCISPQPRRGLLQSSRRVWI